MNLFRSIVLAVLVAAPAVVAFAQDRPARGAASGAADRAAVVASLPRGGAFVSGGEPYRMVGGARALRRAPHESEAQALARHGASSADLIERKGNAYLIVRSKVAPTATLPRSGYLAALNTRTAQLGVVSGILEVHVRKGTDPARLAAAHGLSVVSSAPRLGVTFLQVPVGGDLQRAAAALERDPAVEGVEIDVLEHVNVPH